MKISRIAEALGSISDEISRESVEEIETKSDGVSDNVSAQKPRIVRSEAPRRAPFIIAVASLCAAAAIALPICFSALGNRNIVNSDAGESGANNAPKAELVFDCKNGENKETTYIDLPEYNLTVEFTSDGVYQAPGENQPKEKYKSICVLNGENLLFQNNFKNVYLADMNGDGKRELITTVEFETGRFQDVIYVYDFNSKQRYFLPGSDSAAKTELFENNGVLWFKDEKDGLILRKEVLSLSEMLPCHNIGERSPLSQQDIKYYGIGNIPDIISPTEFMLFEEKNVANYNVKLIGSNVYMRNGNDYNETVFSNSLYLILETNTRISQIADISTFELPISIGAEVKLNMENIGSYLNAYELEKPIITLSFYSDDKIYPRMVKQAVKFFTIENNKIVPINSLYAEAETGVSVYSPESDFSVNYPYDSLRPNSLDGECKFGLAEMTELKYADKNTLLDTAARIQYSFSFNNGNVNISASKIKLLYAPKTKLLFNLRENNDLWDETRKFTVPEYEGVEFLWTADRICANGETLIWGMPVWSVYLADLNGDGKREIVSEVSIGSGIISQGICACDFSEKKLYMLQLQNPVPSECSLFINNGELWVREQKHGSDEILSERKLSLSEMKGYDLNAEKSPNE